VGEYRWDCSTGRVTLLSVVSSSSVKAVVVMQNVLSTVWKTRERRRDCVQFNMHPLRASVVVVFALALWCQTVRGVGSASSEHSSVTSVTHSDLFSIPPHTRQIGKELGVQGTSWFHDDE
jgi:hypothetical protein